MYFLQKFLLFILLTFCGGSVIAQTYADLILQDGEVVKDAIGFGQIQYARDHTIELRDGRSVNLEDIERISYDSKYWEILFASQIHDRPAEASSRDFLIAEHALEGSIDVLVSLGGQLLLRQDGVVHLLDPPLTGDQEDMVFREQIRALIGDCDAIDPARLERLKYRRLPIIKLIKEHNIACGHHEYQHSIRLSSGFGVFASGHLLSYDLPENVSPFFTYGQMEGQRLKFGITSRHRLTAKRWTFSLQPSVAVQRVEIMDTIITENTLFFEPGNSQRSLEMEAWQISPSVQFQLGRVFGVSDKFELFIGAGLVGDFLVSLSGRSDRIHIDTPFPASPRMMEFELEDFEDRRSFGGIAEIGVRYGRLMLSFERVVNPSGFFELKEEIARYHGLRLSYHILATREKS